VIAAAVERLPRPLVATAVARSGAAAARQRRPWSSSEHMVHKSLEVRPSDASSHQPKGPQDQPRCNVIQDWEPIRWERGRGDTPWCKEAESHAKSL